MTDPVKPLITIFENGSFKLHQRLPAEGEPGVAYTVRRWGLLCRAAKQLHDHASSLSAAYRARYNPPERV